MSRFEIAVGGNTPAEGKIKMLSQTYSFQQQMRTLMGHHTAHNEEDEDGVKSFEKWRNNGTR